MRVRRYWLKFRGLPVTFHLRSDWTVLWTGIFGIQVGRTFIGVVRSRDEIPRDDTPTGDEGP